MKNIYLLLFLSFSINLKAQFAEATFPKDVKYFDKVQFYNKDLLLAIENNTLISNNGGKNFNILKSGQPANLQIINDSMFILLESNRLNFTKNKGLTWEEKYFLNDLGDTFQVKNLKDIYIYKNGSGFVTNYIINQKPQVLLTDNWGVTWRNTDSNKNNLTVIDDNAISDKKPYKFDSTLYLLKGTFSKPSIFKVHNYGDSITEINLISKGINSNVRDFAFSDEQNGMLIVGGFNQSIYTTKDGCNTFTKVSNANGQAYSLEYAKPTNNKAGFYILNYSISSIIKGTAYSKDNGQTWVDNIDNTYLQTIDFYDAENGVACSGADANLTSKIYYFTGLPTAINDENHNITSISIYPNPTQNILNLQADESLLKDITDIQIINSNGQMFTVKPNNSQIDIRHLAQGFYCLIINSENGNYKLNFVKD
jgi:hypothetical protein